MTTLDRMLGRNKVDEMTMAGSIVPVGVSCPMMVNPVRKLPPKDGKTAKKLRNTVIDGIIGRKVQENEDNASIFPEDASEVKISVASNTVGNEKNPDMGDNDGPAVPPSGDREALITPQAALVAPDVTPDAFVALDPAQVPPAQQRLHFPQPQAPQQAAGAIDTLMGRQNPAAEIPSAQPQVSAESFMASLGHSTGADIAPLLEAATTPGVGMPAHVGNDIRTLCDVTRRFIR